MPKNMNFALQPITYRKYIRKRKPNKNHPDMTRGYVKQKTEDFLKTGGKITQINIPSANASPLDHSDFF